jgi:hypothetical protein
MSVLVCGLDVHKDSTYATILDSEGKIVDQTRMENEKVASYLSKHKVGRVARESSTAVAPLYCQLKKRSPQRTSARKGSDCTRSLMRIIGNAVQPYFQNLQFRASIMIGKP